jgi:phospholipid-binding lipoprotein MlaA
VLPVLGPSSLRDLVGTGTDFMMDPLAWLIGPVWWIPTGVGAGFTEIDAYHADLEALRAESAEFYAALRNVYYQSRVAAIERAKERSLSARQLVAWLPGGKGYAKGSTCETGSVSAPR